MNIKLIFVAEAFARLPRVEVKIDAEEDRLLVRFACINVPVRVVSRASGYPRDVRQAVWQAREGLEKNEKLVLYVPVLSASSREWLQQEGIGYLDAQGNLFLAAEGVYLLRESGIEPSRSDGPAETNIFRGRATQVLHALLNAPARHWHITDLAKEADVAPGTALRVCEMLEKMLLMEREGRGPQSLRRLNAPGTLLNTWAEKHRLDTYITHRYYRWMADLNILAAVIGTAMEGRGMAYAVTLGLGAMHRAPFLTQVEQVGLLVPNQIDLVRLASDCQLKTVDEGPNVLLLSTRNDSPLMYRQKVDNLWVASDIQLYLDLNAAPGRGREQAEHLRRERIGF